MKTILISVLGALMLGESLTEATASAADDIQFATPVVSDATPACTTGTCAIATETVSARRRPVVNWFQEKRPVRRVLRGAVRFVGRRCCS